MNTSVFLEIKINQRYTAFGSATRRRLWLENNFKAPYISVIARSVLSEGLNVLQ